jgi:hypothetical protein
MFVYRSCLEIYQPTLLIVNCDFAEVSNPVKGVTAWCMFMLLLITASTECKWSVCVLKHKRVHQRYQLSSCMFHCWNTS